MARKTYWLPTFNEAAAYKAVRAFRLGGRWIKVGDDVTKADCRVRTLRQLFEQRKITMVGMPTAKQDRIERFGRRSPPPPAPNSLTVRFAPPPRTAEQIREERATVAIGWREGQEVQRIRGQEAARLQQAAAAPPAEPDAAMEIPAEELRDPGTPVKDPEGDTPVERYELKPAKFGRWFVVDRLTGENMTKALSVTDAQAELVRLSAAKAA